MKIKETEKAILRIVNGEIIPIIIPDGIDIVFLNYDISPDSDSIVHFDKSGNMHTIQTIEGEPLCKK